MIKRRKKIEKITNRNWFVIFRSYDFLRKKNLSELREKETKIWNHGW